MDTLKMVTKDDRKVIEGEKLLDSFGELKERFPIAVWMKPEPERNSDWKLVLASKDYRTKGEISVLKYLYHKLHEINSPLELTDIFVIDSKSELAFILRSYKNRAGGFYKDHPGYIVDEERFNQYPVLSIYHII